MTDIEKNIVGELCGGCPGCSLSPRSISDLCTNPVEKYVARIGEWGIGIIKRLDEASSGEERMCLNGELVGGLNAMSARGEAPWGRVDRV